MSDTQSESRRLLSPIRKTSRMTMNTSVSQNTVCSPMAYSVYVRKIAKLFIRPAKIRRASYEIGPCTKGSDLSTG